LDTKSNIKRKEKIKENYKKNFRCLGCSPLQIVHKKRYYITSWKQVIQAFSNVDNDDKIIPSSACQHKENNKRYSE